MRRWWKPALGAAALVVVIAAGLYAFRGEIALVLLERTLPDTLRADPIAALPDGLHVGLCGSGAPMPSPERGGPCVGVVAGQRLVVIDAGGGAARTLARMGFAPSRVERVLLTHFHSDHIDGLGELMLQRWVGGGHDRPLPVHGPSGVESVVDGFNAAYARDRLYRVAHHGPYVVPPSGAGGVAAPFPIAEAEPVTVLDEGGLRITAFRVEHAPAEPAVGYRVTYGGRVAVISGDTRRSPAVEAAAKDADLLVHEALSPTLTAMIGAAAEAAGRDNLAAIMHDIVDYHTTPEEAAGIAVRANVKFLLLTHIMPPLPRPVFEGTFLGRARTIYRGPLRLGKDGDLVSMPAAGLEIRVTNRFE
jgi:ribonuclease Z